ncbi:hypothetical protein [Methyloceanibacter caenitepidi]|uniref:hypothetical protein n=1 Tax=Methyloceanibacter caenitepidi TaxID=1384459 RepID=UPI0012E03513|nr:hypothetical protein [Methyloceanibacter caenitepidi]
MILFVLVYWPVLLAILVLCTALVVIGRFAHLSWGWSYALIAAAAAVFWIGYSIAFPWHVYRYKLTVDLDVDGETISKSEIYEVRNAKTPLKRFFTLGSPTAGQEHEVFGEAIDFDIGGRHLLITMKGGSDLQGPFGSLLLAQRMLGINVWWSPELRRAMEQGIKKAVPIDALPIMVTFDDPSEPNSLSIVDRDQLSAEFGRSVSIKSASLQMTTDRPGPFDLPRVLTWLSSINRPFPSRIVDGEVHYCPVSFQRDDFVRYPGFGLWADLTKRDLPARRSYRDPWCIQRKG